MNLSRFILTLILVSTMAVGLSGCNWSGSGEGSGHFGGALHR